jgi:lactate dehydrogenase-like 2-hydroxyacid dehydrogenase
MAKPDVLVLAKNIPVILDELPAFCTLHKLYEQTDKEAFLDANKDKFQAIVTSYNVGAKADLIEALPNLKVSQLQVSEITLLNVATFAL